MCPWFLQNYFAILHILSNLNLFAAAFPSIYPFCFLKMYLKQVYTCQNDFTFSQSWLTGKKKSYACHLQLNQKSSLCLNLTVCHSKEKIYNNEKTLCLITISLQLQHRKPHWKTFYSLRKKLKAKLFLLW